MEQRRALYSFEGQGDTEMSMREGDIITVTNKDVGEGWWEGYMANGAQGLFPIDYTEAFDVRLFIDVLEIFLQVFVQFFFRYFDKCLKGFVSNH